MAMSEAMSRRIRAFFNTFNFWTIVLYNILALNSLDFAKLVAKRLLLKGDGCFIREEDLVFLHALTTFCVLTSAGFPITTIIVMFVTYCLVQVIKERERRQALIDDPDPLPPAPPPAAASSPTVPAAAPAAAPTVTQPVVDPSKQKAE